MTIDLASDALPVQVEKLAGEGGSLYVYATKVSVGVQGLHGSASATFISEDDRPTWHIDHPALSFWYINRLLIHESSRGQGFGAFYLKTLVEAAWSQRARPVLVEPGGYGTPIRWLRRWYRKQGFRLVPRTAGAVFVRNWQIL